MPPSPGLQAEAGPSSYPITRDSSGDTSSTDPIPSRTASTSWPAQDGEALDIDPPAYERPSSSSPTTPPSASPTVSSPGGDQRTTDLTGIGEKLGFGNTAWGSSTTAQPMSVHHDFAVESAGPLTPPSSDDGFENIRKKPALASEVSGLGEGYEVVNKDESDMAVDPRSE